MTRLKQLFEQKQQQVLNVYCTAGFPQVDSTLAVMEALQQNGADIIELGMPYSDPLADGEVIQSSSTIALKAGMTISRLFEQLKPMRTRIQIPVVLMGYMNPVLQYGFEKFCADAAAAGVDGLILPDLPPFEFEATYKSIVDRHGLDFIFLVTPETSEARVRKLDALSSGFLYAVSSSSTTGNEKDFSAVEQYLERLAGYNLSNPVLVGFGIKDHETFSRACRFSNGAIIGSAFIKALEGQTDIPGATGKFIKTVLG
ncbi:tryptophan synthase subunit alpha [Niabella beijingensis]|uniref:tryptophan synthase subunit alpha n=1 Tax=Niabella beijingensis TaxID=2872700 RepID=UPI001CC0C2C5|nr:tryptophan synthase subunit alpha [Niabella beijingensis]MBZ4190283.1 tryptophan synthase subunit alpha [Niabella beijingensis]